MKSLFVLLISISTTISFAQKEVTKVLLKGSVFEVSQKIKDDVDTFTYFFWGYQNAKYQHITDIGSVFIVKKDELKLFAEKLIEYGNISERVNQTEKLGRNIITLYDFTDKIYIEDKNGKYTTITKRSAIKIGEEIMNCLHLFNK